MGVRYYAKVLSRRARIRPALWMISSPVKVYELNKVLSLAGLSRNDDVLDFGCGDGLLTGILSPRSRSIIGIDIDPKAIETAKLYMGNRGLNGKCSFVSGDIATVGLPEHSFDCIMSVCVLEHVRNLQDVLREFRRILKPSGRLVVSVDSLATVTDKDLLKTHSDVNRVVQYFDRDSLRNHLTDAGFEMEHFSAILKGTYGKSLFCNKIKGLPIPTSLFGRNVAIRKLQAEDANIFGDEGIILLAVGK